MARRRLLTSTLAALAFCGACLREPDAPVHLTQAHVDLDVLERARKSQAIGEYETAAGLLEQHALMSPTASSAPTALKDAIVLRLALGDDAHARDDQTRFLRAYGATMHDDAALVVLSVPLRLSELEQWQRVVTDLTPVMGVVERGSVYARLLGHALLARAHSHRGATQLALSEYAVVRTVGAELEPPPSSDARELRNYAKGLDAMGEAIVFAADERARNAARQPFPRFVGQGRSVDAWIAASVVPWMNARVALVESLGKDYTQVLDLPFPPPRWVAAAAAHVARMWMAAADEIVKPFATSQERERLAAAVKPLRDLKARPAAVACIDVAVKYQWVGDGDACAGWLVKTYPHEYKAVDEIIPAFRVGPNDVVAQPL
jgi:hypothetical protein